MDEVGELSYPWNMKNAQQQRGEQLLKDAIDFLSGYGARFYNAHDRAVDDAIATLSAALEIA